MLTVVYCDYVLHLPLLSLQPIPKQNLLIFPLFLVCIMTLLLYFLNIVYCLSLHMDHMIVPSIFCLGHPFFTVSSKMSPNLSQKPQRGKLKSSCQQPLCGSLLPCNSCCTQSFHYFRWVTLIVKYT